MPLAGKRTKTTLGEQVVILKRQAACAICGNPLGDGPVEYDHGWALARGGSDEVKNKRAVHKACHAVKTRGSGATTRGSDVGEITKTRHLTEAQEEFRRRLLSKAPGVPREKSGKIKGRGFSR